MIKCSQCSEWVLPRRAELGYPTCLDCGQIAAKRVRHTIVPMHKSNYIVVSDLSLLAQLTRPGRY